MTSAGSARVRKRITPSLGFDLGAVTATVLLCGGVLLAVSPGRVAPFTDESGKTLENSLAEKRHVEINGVDMGMVIKSKDLSNPVLLFVHGGPGMPEYSHRGPSHGSGRTFHSGLLGSARRRIVQQRNPR